MHWSRYVGGPTMAVIAMKCPEYKVTVVDINEQKINQWNSERLPIYEPGLAEIVKKTREVNLFFSTDIKTHIKEADIIFVSVNTPTKTFGLGAEWPPIYNTGKRPPKKSWENSEGPKIIVEKSTLPVKTAEAMERIFRANKDGPRFEVISNPEFLAEGTAIRDLMEPDRVLIGSHQTEAGLRATEEIMNLYAHWVPREKIITNQPVVLGTLQAGGQRLFSSTHFIHKLYFGTLREDRCGCYGKLPSPLARIGASGQAFSMPVWGSEALVSRRIS